MYTNQLYYEKNQTWHIEDSPWKASKIIELIKKNNIQSTSLSSICEVGCGAGEILAQLAKQLPDNISFTGYDIATQLDDFWQERTTKNVKFVNSDFLASEENFDLLLFIDIVEHIEDYIGFLRKIKNRSTYKIFNFPLELFAAKAILGHKYIESRKKYGHLHYFNKEICLSVLEDLGFEIQDYFYAPGAIELSSTTTSITPISRLAKFPRIVLSKINMDFAAKLLGGYSLFILAK